MVHKVEVGGKEYEYKRPVIALERLVRKVNGELAEAMKASDTDEGYAKCADLWRAAVTLMLIAPDEAVLSLDNVTVGETVDVFLSFFEAAQTMNVKPKAG